MTASVIMIMMAKLTAHPTPIMRAFDPAEPEPECLFQAVEVLRGGELVVYPTDTLYGLAADPRMPAAVERLFELKGRSRDVAIPLIAADVSQVESIGRLTPLGARAAAAFWPGPVTLVIDAGPRLSRRLCAGGETVAVRVPDHPVARGLAAALGHPVTATSANRSGEAPASSASGVVRAFGAGVKMVLDGGEVEGDAPSTIIDVRGGGPVLLREGRVSWDRVLQSLT